MTKLKAPKKTSVDVSKIRYETLEVSPGEMLVNFSDETGHLFKLSFDYDPQHRCGMLNSIMVSVDGIDHLVAAAINKYMVEEPNLVSLKSGFGDQSKEYEILFNHRFPSLIRIQILSLDRKAIALTKSLTKLQETFTESKFSLIRLS